MNPKTLTPPQFALLDAIRAGVTCYYMPFAGPNHPGDYYFRCDTHARCTPQLRVLHRLGFVEVEKVGVGGRSKLRATNKKLPESPHAQ